MSDSRPTPLLQQKAARTLTADDPRHGTLNGYTTHGCRCLACTDANRDYQREYMRRHRAGKANTMPAGAVRNYLRMLGENGVTLAVIAEHSGLSLTCLSKIVNRQSRSVRLSTAQAIYGVCLDAVAPGHNVPAEQYRRIVDGMKAAGISERQIQKALRHRDPQIKAGRGQHVYWHSYERIRTLCHMLGQLGYPVGEVLEETA